MKTIAGGIKRADSLLMSALSNINKGNKQAALVDLQAVAKQIQALIDIVKP